MTNAMKSFSDNTYWNDYGRPFSTVTTSFQSQLYASCAIKLTGRVADFGSGTSKITPHLNDNKCITGYIGVECSPLMVREANHLLGKLHNPQFSVIESTIEAFDMVGFDAGVSINSYYAWENHLDCLQVIYDSLKTGAKFIIANPNNTLDMGLLLKEAEKDLITHPDFEEFKQHNVRFAEEMKCNFISMHVLIQQLQQVGFQILSSNTDFFKGGVNMVITQKI